MLLTGVGDETRADAAAVQGTPALRGTARAARSMEDTVERGISDGYA